MKKLLKDCRCNVPYLQFSGSNWSRAWVWYHQLLLKPDGRAEGIAISKTIPPRRCQSSGSSPSWTAMRPPSRGAAAAVQPSGPLRRWWGPCEANRCWSRLLRCGPSSESLHRLFVARPASVPFERTFPCWPPAPVASFSPVLYRPFSSSLFGQSLEWK